jgi:predicted dehydrogenase
VSSPRIGVGIIGLSANRGWAARAHLPALAMMGDYDLRGLVASGSESAKAAALKHRVPFASDRLDELLARSDIDLVVVSVGVPEHRRVVEASLKAGKAVLCEWPLAGAKGYSGLDIPEKYWPFEGERSRVAYNVALTYERVARDLRTGSRSAPTIADALQLHRALEAIEVSA